VVSPRRLEVFDLGNVLVRVDVAPFVDAVLAAIPGADPDFVRTWVTTGPAKLALDRGLAAPRRFLRELTGRLGASEVAPALYEPWTAQFTALPEAAGALAALAEAGTELWLLSDTDPAHFARCLNDHAFLHRFDRFLLSYDRGLVKTDPGAFVELLAEQAAGRPVRFHDDRPDIIEAARGAGLSGALLFEGWESWTER
jgi:glucose-1-phosphatase